MHSRRNRLYTERPQALRTKTGKVKRSKSNAKSAEAVFDDVEVSGHETIPPTPDILDALEADYPLEASIADLVDNSIDAKARNVLVRFMRTREKLFRLCVADDGHGMTETTLRHAMQFAAKRRYGRKDLGMFGLGLKTASLSQAETLVVASKASGHSAVGRQWTKSGIKKHQWRLDKLTAASAEHILGHSWGTLGRIQKGTIVRWDGVYDFERLHAGFDEYLEEIKNRLRSHLGLKLHRFLERRRLRIRIDVEDLETGEIGPPSLITPTNPFPSKGASGAVGYPKNFTVQFPGAGKVTMRAHIWRKKSRDEGYKLGGGRVSEHQGFYFFRHDRLIQDGGWCGILGTTEPHMSLARVEVDIPDSLRKYLRVRSNKAGVDVPASFGSAVHDGRARDGTSFDRYLKKAEEVYRRRGETKPRPMLKPGVGIPAEVRKALENQSVRFIRGEAVSVGWEPMERGFVRIDQEDRRITLNRRFRPLLLRGAHGGKTDVPLVRTLLFFVFESLLAGNRIGAVERRWLLAVQASINAAIRLEAKWADEER